MFSSFHASTRLKRSQQTSWPNFQVVRQTGAVRLFRGGGGRLFHRKAGSASWPCVGHAAWWTSVPCLHQSVAGPYACAFLWPRSWSRASRCRAAWWTNLCRPVSEGWTCHLVQQPVLKHIPAATGLMLPFIACVAKHVRENV